MKNRGPGCILIQDDDSHWYLILANERENFEEWQGDMYEGRESDHDFDRNRIDRPDNIIIYDWEEV